MHGTLEKEQLEIIATDDDDDDKVEFHLPYSCWL